MAIKEQVCRHCGKVIFYSGTVHSWVHVNFLPEAENHQAQPKRNVVPTEHAVALVWNTLKTSGIYRMTLIQIADLLNWSRDDTRSLLDSMKADGFVATFEEAHYSRIVTYYRSLRLQEGL